MLWKNEILKFLRVNREKGKWICDAMPPIFENMPPVRLLWHYALFDFSHGLCLPPPLFPAGCLPYKRYLYKPTSCACARGFENFALSSVLVPVPVFPAASIAAEVHRYRYGATDDLIFFVLYL